ncbi:hypothetical protein G7K_2900-t1 [Saitoella complicata NRRL Y-17804]|uniref:cAMP-dependent protein kinase n=2 Tax=Saitoella complicata (strain BCRC 22490 / CBS 7301 / JCM 7358 / NBRC 10748 / NRRL Y-17804) TaxID=698492 RepID=A0A0E9NH43_SAICN|nr:hypothetical protein G7K_2900-t1 [Saitoella complicata NRRL Y-17804]
MGQAPSHNRRTQPPRQTYRKSNSIPSTASISTVRLPNDSDLHHQRSDQSLVFELHSHRAKAQKKPRDSANGLTYRDVNANPANPQTSVEDIFARLIPLRKNLLHTDTYIRHPQPPSRLSLRPLPAEDRSSPSAQRKSPTTTTSYLSIAMGLWPRSKKDKEKKEAEKAAALANTNTTTTNTKQRPVSTINTNNNGNASRAAAVQGHGLTQTPTTASASTQSSLPSQRSTPTSQQQHHVPAPVVAQQQVPVPVPVQQVQQQTVDQQMRLAQAQKHTQQVYPPAPQVIQQQQQQPLGYGIPQQQQKPVSVPQPQIQQQQQQAYKPVEAPRQSIADVEMRSPSPIPLPVSDGVGQVVQTQERLEQLHGNSLVQQFGQANLGGLVSGVPAQQTAQPVRQAAVVPQQAATQQQQQVVPQAAAAQQVRSTKGKYTLNDFSIQRTLGTGSFGRVHLVQSRHNKRFYAIKVLKKQQVVKMKQVEHTNDERSMLQRVKHPFLITLWGTFQDSRNLYMVMDFIEGGELFSLLRKSQRFPDPVAKFYAAEVALALDYLHSLNIIYRDLKPENLLLDRQGHIKITDFGFAKEVRDITWTLCGTPDYLAPEVVASKGYNKSVDWWSLGILTFEMLAGYPPFYDQVPMKLYENILEGKVRYPAYFNPSAKDLLSKLLTSDLTKRFGNLRSGSGDVMQHSWFGEVNWERLARREIEAPYVPPVKKEGGDASLFDRYPEEDYSVEYGQRGADPYGHLFVDF